MAYRVIAIDLGTANADKQIFPPGKTIREIACLAVPVGASFKLRIGENPDAFSVSAPFSMEPRGDTKDTDYGVYLTNVAQAGMAIELVISTGPSQLNTIAQ